MFDLIAYINGIGTTTDPIEFLVIVLGISTVIVGLNEFFKGE